MQLVLCSPLMIASLLRKDKRANIYSQSFVPSTENASILLRDKAINVYVWI